LGVQAADEADVLVANVDVDEPSQLAALVDHPLLDPGVGRLQRVEQLRQRRTLGGDLLGPAGVVPQDGRNAYRSAHGRSSFQKFSKSSYRGGMVVLGPTWSATASSVFSPSPELITTVSASGSSRPSAISLAVTPTVTPPAVSPKMPSVRASRRMLVTTVSSSTSAITPPVRRTVSSTYGPSAGLPIASDLAMVSGFTGRTTS